MNSDQMEIRALLVDDDPLVCRVLKFALQQEGFKCDVAADGDIAIERLQSETYELLVTDLKMPNKNGHSLVMEVIDKGMHPIIVVHTSVDEPKLTKDLIIRGVDDVIYKPTNYASFAAKARGMVIRRHLQEQSNSRIPVQREQASAKGTTGNNGTKAQAIFQKVSLDEMGARLQDISKVKSISQVAVDVLSMVQSSKFDSQQVASMVHQNRDLTRFVLEIATSPFYNPAGTPINSIEDAVTRIGQKRVGEFLLATSAFATIAPESLPWFDLELMWKQSLASCLAVELLISQGKHFALSDGLVFSTLMHNAGRIILGKYYPEYYDKFIHCSKENNEALRNYEGQVFSKPHPQVLCDLLANWEIPNHLVEPLKHISLDYQTIASLPEAARTKAELAKLAILIGHITVGKWEPWEWIDLPSSEVLAHVRISSFQSIVEQIRTQLHGVECIKFDTKRKLNASNRSESLVPMRLFYCSVQPRHNDILAALLPTLGFALRIVAAPFEQMQSKAAVNHLGKITPEIATETFRRYESVCFVTGPSPSCNEDYNGKQVEIPCSVAALKNACLKVAIED
jgi:HD-like signal output (HDOD) protein/ActR/RegA family two-component response regulator